MNALLSLIVTVLGIYLWFVIGRVIMSWLVQFNVVNTSQPIVQTIGAALTQLTEPVLRPIRDLLRRIGLGNLGGIDLSPMVLILAIIFIRNFILLDLAPVLRG